jgi:RNA polymerase sigma-70 factor (ECF subfamily)
MAASQAQTLNPVAPLPLLGGGERAVVWQRVDPAEETPDFEALVESCYRRTYNLIYRMVRSESDAADLTQETFVRVYRALPRLRADGAKYAWVRRIATNLCLDFLRRRNHSPGLLSLDARMPDDSDTAAVWDIVDPSGEPERLLDSSESRRLLYRAIDSLPDDYRAVIWLHHLEEMRVDEIAKMMGVPTGTIKSRLSRARRELHRKLIPYFDPDVR